LRSIISIFAAIFSAGLQVLREVTNFFKTYKKSQLSITKKNT
jgi:hypothetical protein